MQGRNRDGDVENEHVDTGEGRVSQIGKVGLTCIYCVYKIDGKWEAAVSHRELSSGLCDDLGGGMEGRVGEGGDICIQIADLLCCMAETNIVKQLYSNKNF